MTHTHIDPALARDIAAMERELLLDADPQLLGVYADMLEESVLGDEVYNPIPDNPESTTDAIRRIIRDGPLCQWATVLGLFRRSGFVHISRPGRLALACFLDATHPVESAELRLSIASGEWPCLWRRAFPEFFSRLRGGPLARVTSGGAPDGRGAEWCVETVADTWGGFWRWRPAAGWTRGGPLEPFGLWPDRRDDAVRAAAREWIARILDKETT